MAAQIKLHTVCMVRQGEKVLLLNRLNDPTIQGYIAPGGKIEFPESPSEGAIREVREETGLVVRDLVYKGLHEFVNEERSERYVIFNYITESFAGDLLEAPPEGALEWVSLADLADLPMLRSFRTRFPLFFEPGTFEIHTKWNDSGYEESVVRM
jgi:8-oxo-dGTP diphosphatase